MNMDCASCNKQVEYPPVPFVVHENLRAQMDMHARRLVRVIVLLIVLLVGSNIAWLFYESSFREEEITVRQINDTGYYNYIGNDGDITNGAPGNNH